MSGLTWAQQRQVLEGRNHRGRKAVRSHCMHPSGCLVEGANQYGRWTRCLRCQTKIDYQPHVQRVPTKKEMRSRKVEYVPVSVTKIEKGATRIPAAKEKSSSSTEVGQPDTRAEVLQETLLQSNQQLLSGMSHLMSQAIGPVLQGQQTMFEMQQQQTMGYTSMLNTMQTTQLEMTNAMRELVQQIGQSRQSIEAEE